MFGEMKVKIYSAVMRLVLMSGAKKWALMKREEEKLETYGVRMF